MPRVIGVDPGTGSWDFFGLDGDDVVLDTSVPTKRVVKDPTIFLDVIRSVEEPDLIMAPSGFGLPLKPVQELTEADVSHAMVKKDRGKKLVGLSETLRALRELDVPGYVLPGVKHLPTVPTYRKFNKIDMGTADKVCTAVVGMRDQSERLGVPFEETGFVMVEIGQGFSAVLAVERGQIVDGIGGTNVMGFQACGGLDGELAYLLGEVHKKNIYQGGVASIAGSPDLSPEELFLLGSRDEHTREALRAFTESLAKAVYSLQVSYEDRSYLREVLVAGRGARWSQVFDALHSAASPLAPVRVMGSYAQIAKRAAQGSAFIANGLAGGRFAPLVENLRIRESSGSILDHVYIPHDGPLL
ncbi:MAG: DUF1464 family protein [Promethearchaeota archaeon]